MAMFRCGGGKKALSKTFTVAHNTGSSSAPWTVTQNIATGIPKNKILYVFYHTYTSKGVNCSAVTQTITDDGNIYFNITIQGDVHFSVGSTYVYVVYYE